MKVEFSHALEDMTGSFSVSFGVRGGDEEVIHVDDKPPFSDHVLERVIHESLEHGRGIAKAKEHDGGFEESFVGDEGRFPLVAILDADIVVPPMDVELGEMVGVL